MLGMRKRPEASCNDYDQGMYNLGTAAIVRFEVIPSRNELLAVTQPLYDLSS